MMLTGKALFHSLLMELNEMGLPGMSATLDEMYRSPSFLELDPLTAIASLVEPEYQKKMNKRIQSRLRSAHLRGCPQELSDCVDSAQREYLPRGITATLSTLDFIDSGLNICILGPSDSGKSYLAKAIGIAACNTYRVEYHHCESLLEALVALKAQDYAKYQKRLKKICGAALLILDDFLLHTITDEREVKILFEILEKRCEMNLRVNPKFCVNSIEGANRAKFICGGSKVIRLPLCQQHNAGGTGCQGRRSRLSCP